MSKWIFRMGLVTDETMSPVVQNRFQAPSPAIQPNFIADYQLRKKRHIEIAGGVRPTPNPIRRPNAACLDHFKPFKLSTALMTVHKDSSHHQSFPTRQPRPEGDPLIGLPMDKSICDVIAEVECIERGCTP
jgi:hypothetical protein